MSAPNSDQARDQLIDLAAQFYDQFELGEIPHMSVPTRTKSNIEYSEDKDVWVYGDRESRRTANTVSGARKLLKAVYTIDFLSDQLDQDRSSTLRELYYLSESWDNDNAQFNDQDESNQLIEDLEIVSAVRREDFHMRPEESGATIMGPLFLREQTRRGERDIHCQEDVGEGGYQIPNNPDTIEFLDNDAEFILAVETGGNVEGSKVDEEVELHGVRVVGLANLPGRVPVHASQMYASNLAHLIESYWDAESKTMALPLDDEIIQGCLVTHGGAVVNEQLPQSPKPAGGEQPEAPDAEEGGEPDTPEPEDSEAPKPEEG